MFFSKGMITRFIIIAGIVLVLWSMWKRIDAIIDNYQKYYDVALINKLWDQQSNKFNQEWAKFDRDFQSKWSGYGKGLDNQNQNSGLNEDVEKKWQEYKEKSIFPPENKPVPAYADEYTKGYYYGLWNFFITSGFASIFAAVFFITVGILLARMVWRRVTDEVVEKIFSRFF